MAISKCKDSIKKRFKEESGQHFSSTHDKPMICGKHIAEKHRTARFANPLCGRWIPVVSASICKTVRFASQNGAFCNVKWCVLQCKMVRFAMQNGAF